MRKLWELNREYDPSKPQPLRNKPYKLLHNRNLTLEELEELLRDAKRLNWKALDLSDTQITALPESIGQLSSLQSLFLSGTQITALPDWIGQLSSLQSLYLSDTQITALPESIGQLSSLQKLDLCSCHLKSIPYSLVKLGLPFITNERFPELKDHPDSKKYINLTGVTLDEGELSLFAQPREVIEAAYQKQTQIRECKVIFLGDGGAGKTALIERIRHDNFTPGTPSTEGIEMSKWFMSVEMNKWETNVEDKPFTLRFLDFGGQEIMHSAHRCFLTAHTVYVVVCESRDDTEIDSAAARWLESVNSFAPGCPVILALNKADLNANVSVNERDLKQRNPALKLVLKTSAAVPKEDKKYGAQRLIDAVRDEIPGAVNDYKVNADMIGIKQALEDMKEKEKAGYISSKRYREICAEHHITDETLQYSLLGFFRDLGVAYYYETPSVDTRLESVRVLDPEWLTNGIYRLILRTPENGFLRHREIKKTLRASHAGDIHREITYSPEETEYILHVMRYFEISHDIGGGVEMIPLKMSKTPPDSIDEFLKENALHLRWEGSYLPNNLIHRLLIRKFPELDRKCVWRTGGRFRQEGGGCTALAEMNEKALNVYVNGNRDCRPYLETFRGVIQNILNGLNLKVSEVICCTVDGQEGHVPYKDVMRQYYDKRKTIYISDIEKYVSPDKLLRDTYPDWEKEAERYRQQLEHTFRPAPPPPDKPPEENPVNPLEEEKTRAEIAQLQAEAKKNNVAVTLTVARALLIPALIVLAWVAGRSDLIEKFLEFLFSLFSGL